VKHQRNSGYVSLKGRSPERATEWNIGPSGIQPSIDAPVTPNGV